MINLVITLKWTLLVITLTRANAEDTHGIERRGTNADSAKKIVCYYTNWSVYRPGTAKFSPQNVNPYLCTHLIYAFGGLDKENGLRPYDKYQDIEQGGYAKFTGLKTYNKNLKTMLAIGGWNEGSAKFSALVADEERRAIFVKNVIKFLRQNNFDGLDLDWEYPAFRDGSKADDKENYASLVKELREEFERESSKTGRPRLLLTMAVPAGIEYIDKGYDVPKLNKYLDFMNILSYDYHSAYEPNVNHHSPLYSLQEESEYNFDAQLTIDHTVNHYLKKGVDREKLILGIPTYGRSYTLFNADSTDLGSPADGPGEQGEATREKGYLAYYEICSSLENDKQWKVVQPKTSAMGPYAYRGNQWVSYDDTDIVKLKAKYVNEKGLGGIMYWSIDNDDFRGKCHGKPYPLIEAGKEALLANTGSSSNAIDSTTYEEKRPSKLANKRNRPKSQSAASTSTTTKRPSTTSTTTTTTTFNPLSTPEPPTTPDPGTDFVCKEEGFFPHPRDCKKYFWCLDSGPSNLGIVAHQFTCPSGLMFNKAADSCDYSRNVICNKKSEKTTTVKSTSAIPSATSKSATKPVLKTTTITTTTSTTSTESSPTLTETEYEDAEDADSQEDPKAIKQLITLIKKLGGIAELEKQLKLEDGSAEATTPAISKTLYNKVFSSPVSSRNQNQHRNGPLNFQPESSNDDVPYNRKDKPQYVTIQRSRPLKNVAQDAENSGTTNNKSVQPGKYDESVDYEEDVTEGETTTIKYSSPSRHRSSSSADGSRSTPLKYVTLERNKSDRTTTSTSTSDEELKSESPSTTQRYVTLVRQRSSTLAEYEQANTEALTQTTGSSSQTTSQTTAEKLKEKVSEIESTTNLPVTSAQYNTDRVQTLTTVEYLDNVTTTTTSATVTIPKAYLVFSKQSVDDALDKNDQAPTTVTLELQRRDDDNNTNDEPTLTTMTTTDSITEVPTSALSTSTSVITTIRESPTEKTRIPLKRYKEYLRNNKTDLLYELRSNKIATDNPKPIGGDGQAGAQTTTSTSDSTITKPSTFSRKRLRYSTPSAIDATTRQSANSSNTANNAHSRFFLKRLKNVSSSSTSAQDGGLVDSTARPDLLYKHTKLPLPETPEKNETKAPRFGGKKYQNWTQRESDSIGSFLARRRLSTTDKSSSMTQSTTIATTKASRYFSRSRKPSTASSSPPAYKAVTQHSEILDSDENRYEIRPTTSSSESATNNPSFSGVVGPTTSTDEFATRSASTESKFEHESSIASIAATSNNRTASEQFERAENETRIRTQSPNNGKGGGETNKAFRNNSRFLKNPETEYVDEVKVSRIENQTTAKYSTQDRAHRFGTPIRVAQIQHGKPTEHSDWQTTSEKAFTSNRVLHRERDDGSSQASARRGRKKFGDSVNEAANVVPATMAVFDERNAATTTTTTTRSKPTDRRLRSRFRLTHDVAAAAATPSVLESLEKEFRIRSRPAAAVTVISTDSHENESKPRPRFYHPSNRTNTTTTTTPPPPKHSDGDDASNASLTHSSQNNTNNVRPVTRDRGRVKAQNSLSKSEIRELATLANSQAELKRRKNPKPIVEETFERNVDVDALRYGIDSDRNAAALHAAPTILERSFEETTDTIYVLDGNSIANVDELNDADDNRSKNTAEIFRASETKYTNGELNAVTAAVAVATNTTIKQNIESSSVSGDERTISANHPEPSSRYRENFRRTSSPRSRSRPTTTTTTTEYTHANESSRLANRFRRRKIKPENRSTDRGSDRKNENSYLFTQPVETSTTKPKSVDISQRGSTTISDFLPVPAPLYRGNITNNNLDIPYNINGVGVEDLEAQTINTRTSYYNTEDVSDLADPAVVAIHNLKTAPPIPAQTTYSKALSSLAPQLAYTKEITLRSFPKIKATSTPTILPNSSPRSTIRRGTVRLSPKTSTTTQIPLLQDIYNDYHEADVEYHADPVDIPITGKVRIHSDGYIECLDMGNFPHPFSCKKFISCAKMEYDSLLGWEYTCPKGLSFDPIGGICNWSAGLGCKE